MKLTNLHNITKEMWKENQLFTVFPYKIFNVEFDVYYSIGFVPYRLLIIQTASDFSIELAIEKGYEANPFIDKKTYSILCKILGLKYDPDNPFSPSKFLLNINDIIPFSPIQVPQSKKDQLYKYVVTDKKERNQGIYYLCKKTWRNGEKRSKCNSEKTFYLYPSLYDIIKSNDRISICYTNDMSKSKSFLDDL